MNQKIDLIKQLKEKEIDPNIKECKGLFFRGYINYFYSSNTNKEESKNGL